MTRCAEFYQKWEKDPNWCERTKASVANIDSYLAIVSSLSEKFNLERDVIFQNFSERQYRLVCRMEGGMREAALEKIGTVLESQPRRITTNDIHRFLGYEPKIYFVKGGPFVKIGTSSFTDVRLCALQTGNPYKLEVIAELAGEKESEFHRRFDHLKTEAENEWYHYSKEMRDFVDGVL